MARRIPPLNPLRVFEVVARTGNLTLAAQELHVTQSAVSRQIATLESYLGVELFRRERHGVTLTRIGRAYAEQVVPAFETIAGATERLLKGSTQGALRVRTYVTFAAKWLIPRLPEFQRDHPGIEVRISNAVPDVDFDRDPVDVAIQFGDGRWPRVQADPLFADEIEPVCSPGYLAEHVKDRRRPEALLRQRLLVSHYRRSDWDDWLAATGLAPCAQGAERMQFSSSVLTWQAALDGLGVAIGQTAMLEPEFRSGRLVRPFARPVRSGRAYWLVRPLVQRESRKVAAFREWLLATSRGAAELSGVAGA
ncbi:MAG TPA: transcriptional regulator GcvA [Albitalea sp.]